MSQALEIYVPPASKRPAGVTPRQWRHAALLDRCASAYEACVRAGYAPSTARAAAYRLSASIGTKRAYEAQNGNKADSARGLVGRGMAALEGNVEQLEPREKVQFGLAAVKLGYEIGENVEQSGDASAHAKRLRRAMLLAYRMGAAAQRATPLDVVVSPRHNPKSRK